MELDDLLRQLRESREPAPEEGAYEPGALLMRLARQQMAAPAAKQARAGAGQSGLPPEGDIQEYARAKARRMFGGGQWGALNELVQRESGWDPKAQNPTSTAYGLFQFLDSTFANYGGKTSDPYKQINKGLRYIKDRYGSPKGAWDFWGENRWY